MAGVWKWDAARKQYYRYDEADNCYVYADGQRLPLSGQAKVGNRGTETPPATAPVTGPSHSHALSGDSSTTNWSVETAVTSLSLYDNTSHSEAVSQGDYQVPAVPVATAPTSSVDQSSYGASSYPQDYPTADPPPEFCSGASPSVSYSVPGAFDQQAYDAQSQSGGYGAGTITTSPGTDATSEAQSSDQPTGTLLAREPSDPEKLEEVARNVEQPGPQSVGLRVHKFLRGTNGEYEKLDPNFYVRRPGHTYFKRGTVFRVLWPELASDRAIPGATIATTPLFPNEKFFVKIRWFVVVREGNDCCTCLSIQTYRGKGVPSTKVKNHHSIIYTGDHPPEPLPSEYPRGPWELPMGPPIRVICDKPWYKMESTSRVNFLKIYTVEHYVKVHHFGMVDNSRDEWSLVHQFNSHWNIPKGVELPPATRPSQHSAATYGSTHTEGTPMHPAQAPGYHRWPRTMPSISEQSNQSPYQHPTQAPYQPNQARFQHPIQPPYQHSNQDPYQQPNQAPYQQPNQALYQQPNQAHYQASYQAPHQVPHQAPNQPQYQAQSYHPYQSAPLPVQQSQYPVSAPHHEERPRPRTHRSSGSHTSSSSHTGRSKHPDEYGRRH